MYKFLQRSIESKLVSHETEYNVLYSTSVGDLLSYVVTTSIAGGCPR